MTTRLVLVGEGDFSFTKALSKLLTSDADIVQSWLGGTIPTQIVSTSLDSLTEVLEEYPSFAHLAFPKCVSVFHSVNALSTGDWHRVCGPQSVEYVVWNHPHLGTEDCVEHFQLLCHFFHTIASLPQCRDATVIVSLLTGQVDRWRLIEAARRHEYVLVRSAPLLEHEFPGYTCKRNLSGDSFKSARSKSNWSDNDLVSTFFYFKPRSSGTVEIPLSRPHGGEAGPEPIYTCSQCGKTYKSQQGLTTHVRQVHELKQYGDSGCAVTCEVCGKEVRGEKALQMHMAGAHGGLSVKKSDMGAKRVRTEYLCEHCGSTDPDHIIKFGQNRPRSTIPCPQCGKEFKEPRALNQHINIVHSPS